MPRTARVDIGDEYYHVINRANGRMRIFNTPEDYSLFEILLREAVELIDMRLLAYTIMPNHWHLVLHPRGDGDLGLFIHRLSNSHTRKVHALTGTNGAGHLYQGRYKSFLVDTDAYILSLIRYVERNPVRAGLVTKSNDWNWGSAIKRNKDGSPKTALLSTVPVDLPHEYHEWVDIPENDTELEALRASVVKGIPYGRVEWVTEMVSRYALEPTMRNPGRPRKEKY